MVNKNYASGRQFEYRVKKQYEKWGFYVLRSYASKGAADLYCFRACRNCSECVSCELLLVQCKAYDTTKRKYPHEESKLLKELAKKTGGTAILVSNIRHRLHIEKL